MGGEWCVCDVSGKGRLVEIGMVIRMELRVVKLAGARVYICLIIVVFSCCRKELPIPGCSVQCILYRFPSRAKAVGTKCRESGDLADVVLVP